MEPKFVLSYDISFDEYLEYNKTVADLTLPSNRKRTVGQGIIIVVLALFLVLYNIFFSDKNIWYTLLGLLMLGVGLYISLFYKLVAPKMLLKSAKDAYESDLDGFKNRILTLCDGYFTDRPDGGYGEIDWCEVKGVLETDTQILILFPDNRATIIPKSKADDPALIDFLKEKMNEKGKEYNYIGDR